MRKHSVIMAPLLAAVCSLLLISGCGAGSKENRSDETVPVPSPQVNSGPEKTHESEGGEPKLSEEETIEQLYRKCLPVTVCIDTPQGNNGTGFVYESNFVITNAHVLYDTDSFTLIDQSGSELSGSVIFRDDPSDIAIIRLDEEREESVVLGDSDLVKPGDQLLLIGNPNDGEPFSWCTGKCLDLSETPELAPASYSAYLPMDAPIVSGYSGGPVFTMSGELVGLSNAAYVNDLSAYGLDHLSFAIPINSVIDEIRSAIAE